MERAREFHIELGPIDQNHRVGSLAEGGRFQPLERFPEAWEDPPDLEQPYNGKIIGVQNRPYTCRPHQRSGRAKELQVQFWRSLPQSLYESGGMSVSGRFARDYHQSKRARGLRHLLDNSKTRRLEGHRVSVERKIRDQGRNSRQQDFR
jgi:hypothetical protein